MSPFGKDYNVILGHESALLWRHGGNGDLSPEYTPTVAKWRHLSRREACITARNTVPKSQTLTLIKWFWNQEFSIVAQIHWKNPIYAGLVSRCKHACTPGRATSLKTTGYSCIYFMKTLSSICWTSHMHGPHCYTWVWHWNKTLLVFSNKTSEVKSTIIPANMDAPNCSGFHPC